ncbi:hypothetical protein CVT24_009984, partial [Panaeolus cyanescens]
SRPPSVNSQTNGEENPSPAKRPRKDSNSQELPPSSWQRTAPGAALPDSQGSANGPLRPPSAMSMTDIQETQPASELDIHQPRFASKPLGPRNGEPITHFKDSRKTAIVSAIFNADDPTPVIEILRELADPAAPDLLEVDMVLDDQGHTALHMAASLGRLRIVEALIDHGADIHRGNLLGETPLIRSCLATNCSDQQSFPALVTFLHPSIHTLDTSRKSVLHHIISLAGVKGRAPAARYYLDEILIWIAQNQAGDFRSIVDLQDEHGDTALNIAARVGNRGLVRTMLDVGANRIIPNKLGLRPGDFGVETEELSGGPRAEDILSSLRSGPPAPVQKSQDVIADMTTMIQNLSNEFQTEIKVKQDALDVTQAHLRAATRELAEQRKQIQAWQSRCGELDQVNQRVRNVEKAILNEDQFDWTGRTDLDGNDARPTAGPTFQYRGVNSTMIGVAGSVDISFSVDSEPPLPAGDSVATLIKLRRMKIWHTRMEDLVKERLKSLQGASAVREYQCKKIVALCAGLPIDRVEEMLDKLVIALESDSQIVDLARISGFMQKVRDGVI